MKYEMYTNCTNRKKYEFLQKSVLLPIDITDIKDH